MPKRYVIPRVPASSPSGASSSSATTTVAKRIGRGVSFEDEVIQESTVGEDDDDDAGVDVMDSAVVSDGETTIPPPPAILRDYLGPAPSSANDLKGRGGDVLSPAPPDDNIAGILKHFEMEMAVFGHETGGSVVDMSAALDSENARLIAEATADAADTLNTYGTYR